MHQGSVTESTVVCCCHGCCFQRGEKWVLPSELYADDLVIMAPTMEQLGRQVADWRASLLGSSGGKMIANSGTWPCGVCGKGVQANSVQCTV